MIHKRSTALERSVIIFYWGLKPFFVLFWVPFIIGVLPVGATNIGIKFVYQCLLGHLGVYRTCRQWDCAEHALWELKLSVETHMHLCSAMVWRAHLSPVYFDWGTMGKIGLPFDLLPTRKVYNWWGQYLGQSPSHWIVQYPFQRIYLYPA